MDPNEWKRREECSRKDQAERDVLFEKTLTLARKQSMAIRMLLDEEEHKEKRDDMRAAYMEHGTGFDPCQIQGSDRPSRHYEEITGAPQCSVSSFNVLMGLEDANACAPTQERGTGSQLVGGVCPPPCVPRSQRSASDILSMSPQGSPQQMCQDDIGLLPPSCFDGGDDMLLTPPVGAMQQSRRGRLPEPLTEQYDPQLWHQPPQNCNEARVEGDDMELTPVRPSRISSMRPEHQALLDRARRTVEEATRKFNIIPSTAPHPLSYSFSSQPRQPLATLYCESQPSTSRMQFGQECDDFLPASTTQCVEQDNLPAPQVTFPKSPPSPCPPSTSPSRRIADDPQLQFRPPGRSPPSPCVSSPRAASAGPTRSTPSGTGAIRRPASASSVPARPTRETVQAAAAAGTLKGTQAEIEAMGFQGRDMDEMGAEWQFVDQHVTPYQQPPPQVEGAVSGLSGLLKLAGAEGGKKKRVLLKRKVLKITIPPRPDSPSQEMPYMYGEQDPQYSVRQGPLLPPRRLTPSPPNTCYQSIPPYPRTTQQLQSRLDLEADWQRRQESVPTREYPEDKKKQFGKPLPKSFTTGKPKKLPSYRGGAQGPAEPQPTPSTSFGMAMGGAGRPQAPTTRTGLVLRTPSTPTTSRGRSAPSRGGRGGTPVRGRGGRSASPSPTMSAPIRDYIEEPMAAVLDRLQQLEERVFEVPKRIKSKFDDLHPMDYINEGVDRVKDVFQSGVDKLEDFHPMEYFEEGVDFARDVVKSGVDKLEDFHPMEYFEEGMDFARDVVKSGVDKGKDLFGEFSGVLKKDFSSPIRDVSPTPTRSSPQHDSSACWSGPQEYDRRGASPGPTRSSPLSQGGDLGGMRELDKVAKEFMKNKAKWDKASQLLEKEVERLEELDRQQSNLRGASPSPTRSSPASGSSNLRGASPSPTRSSPASGSIESEAEILSSEIEKEIASILQDVERMKNEIKYLEEHCPDLQGLGLQSGGDRGTSPHPTRSSPVDYVEEAVSTVEQMIQRIKSRLESALGNL